MAFDGDVDGAVVRVLNEACLEAQLLERAAKASPEKVVAAARKGLYLDGD